MQIFACSSLRKTCLYSELFWSAFSSIRTEQGPTLSISSYSVRLRENTDQNNSEYGHFLPSDRYQTVVVLRTFFQILTINYEMRFLTSMFYFQKGFLFDLIFCFETVQKMKFSIKDFFSKCDQIRRKLSATQMFSVHR